MNNLIFRQKTMLSAVLCTLLSIALIVFIIRPYVNRQTLQNEQSTTMAKDGSEIKKPVFIYCLSADDLKNKEIKASIEKLTKEYGTRVVFEICNVSENKKLLNEYPVKDNTPALLMQDSDGNICDILFKAYDYEILKKSVEKAFEK